MSPDPNVAAHDAETFRRTVLLAERLGVSVIVGFSGCPGGSPTDTMPNWVTYRWPPEYGKMLDWQWKEKVIPYWKEATKFARDHGIHKIALEMHPNFVVYNPMTLLKLREAVGEEIGANCDLSHLFWQQCDAVEVIRMLGKQGAIFHAHMKDTTFYKNNLDRYGVLNFAFDKSDYSSLGNISRRRLWSQCRHMEGNYPSVHGSRIPGYLQRRERRPNSFRRSRSGARPVCAEKR